MLLCPVNYRHGSDGQHFRLNFVKGVIVEMCRGNCISDSCVVSWSGFPRSNYTKHSLLID